MNTLKGSRTEHNLMAAFAGESQARNRYTFYAGIASKEGHEGVALIFLETAANEMMHAKRYFELLEGGDVEITAGYPSKIGSTAVNLEAAAHQLEAGANGDVFSPLLGLAGQLSLIRGGLDPTIRAAADPNDRLTPLAHVNRALTLLDGVPPSAGPADLLVWSLRLQDLRDTLLAAGLGRSYGRFEG